MDRYELGSAALCGSCHDIELPSPPAPPPAQGVPVQLERTFDEWRSSVFLLGKDPEIPGLTCNGCHMKPSPFLREGTVGGAGAHGKLRRLNEHLFPGVDVAFGTFPRSGDAASDAALDEHHRAAVQSFLDPAVRVEKVCTKPSLDRKGTRIYVSLDNVGAGHAWPSGAAQDRRAWVEIEVYREGEATPVYSSGVVAPGEDVTRIDDPDLWLFRDRAFDASGKPAHMFWNIAELARGTMGAAVTRDAADPRFLAGHSIRYFPKEEGSSIAGVDYRQARITVRLFLQSVGFDVIDDLIASGHLDPALRDQVPARLLHFDAHLDPRYSFEFSSATWDSPYLVSAPVDELGGEGRCLAARKN